MSKSLTTILEEVKQEARVEGSEDLDSWIKSVINEIYRDYCQDNDYPELHVYDTPLTAVTDGQSQFNLPADFKAVIEVQFSENGEHFFQLTPRNSWGLRSSSGLPSRWFISQGKLNVYPYSDVKVDGVVRLSYKRVPDEMSDDDILEVNELYPVIKKETIARVLRYHKQHNEATQYVADAQRSYNKGTN